jgi:hypothetical protein
MRRLIISLVAGPVAVPSSIFRMNIAPTSPHSPGRDGRERVRDSIVARHSARANVRARLQGRRLGRWTREEASSSSDQIRRESGK